MTETLAEKTCTPCRGGVPPLARDEALRFQAQAPDWELRDEAHRIERTFRFHNFREALAEAKILMEAKADCHAFDIHNNVTFAGWIGYLIAGFIGACILIAIARAFSGGLQQRT